MLTTNPIRIRKSYGLTTTLNEPSSIVGWTMVILYNPNIKGLTLLLSRGKLEKKIHRVAISQGGLRISHSYFEDDNLLFGQASMDEC
jgi:hypothetical protein